ncbi:hypothetical protein ONZ45_g18105 [Pleurotus djamor]|nr:hypothetical protein ONZ45_g18105 [Pleurotus djamor]
MVIHRVKGRFARAPPTLTKTVATAAVARLPDEVLSLIFVHIISVADSELTTGLHNVRLSFIMNIRRPLCGVCRHWLRVALATPQLWSTIMISHLDNITAEMLTFSKELPLRLIVPASQVSRAERVMAPACARVRELDVVLDAQVLSYPSQSDDIASFNFGSQSFTFFAPAMLQTLRIHAIDLAVGPLSQCLPWASMSSLSFLEFSETLPQEKLPKLPSLRTLNINFRGPSSRSVPVSWLLRSLVNIPNVEGVEVFIVSSDKEDPSTLPLRISLPRLKTIRVFAHDLDGSKLFERIDMPSTTCVETRFHRHLPSFDPWVIPVSLNKLFTNQPTL